jgi:hypothetical protein
MEKLLIVCSNKDQSDFAQAYLKKRGAKVSVEPVQDVSLSEATGTPPDVQFQGKYTKMGETLFLVTGTWN